MSLVSSGCIMCHLAHIFHHHRVRLYGDVSAAHAPSGAQIMDGRVDGWVDGWMLQVFSPLRVAE